MDRINILVVEDEEEIQQLVCYNLLKTGLYPVCAASGEEALRLLAASTPALVILDRMLPDMDGIRICDAIRKNPALRLLPVLMLTAKGEDSDIVQGLSHDADDYIPKPFSPQVLVARIEALLRRAGAKTSHDVPPRCFGSLNVDTARHEVRAEGKRVQLTASEFAILALFSGHPGRVFSRQQIIDAVRGEGYAVTERLVDVQISGLRKKIGQAGELVETVRGVGYRLRDEA